MLPLIGSLAFAMIVRIAGRMSGKRKPTIPNAEVQALADDALKAWESGVEARRTDSLGAVWTFLAERDPQPGLRLSRSLPEKAAATGFITQRELGVEDPRPAVTAIALALAEPI